MRALIIALGVVLLAGWYLLGTTPGRARTPGLSPDLVPFAAPGPHPVGTLDVPPDDDDAPALSLWYPAEANESTPVTYRYTIRIAGWLGTTSIGTIAGTAARGVPADQASGPHPVVVLAPGYAIGPTAYAWLAEHLTSHGFVVVAHGTDETLASAMGDGLWRATVQRPRTLRAVLDRVDDLAAPGGELAGLVDPERIAVVGHSYGGYTALTAGGARLDTAGFGDRCAESRADGDSAGWLCDALLPHLQAMASMAGLDTVPDGLWPDWRAPRVDAVVSLAGDAYLFDEAGLAELEVPVLAVGGTADDDTPYDWGTAPTYAHAAGERRARARLDGADHLVFTARCSATRRIARLVPNGFCNERTWDRERAHDVVRHLVTAFLHAELRDDPAGAAALAPDRVAVDGVAYDAIGYG